MDTDQRRSDSFVQVQLSNTVTVARAARRRFIHYNMCPVGIRFWQTITGTKRTGQVVRDHPSLGRFKHTPGPSRVTEPTKLFEPLRMRYFTLYG